MERIKAGIFTKTGTPIKIEEVEFPQLRPGEILVKNEYTTLCRSDLNTYFGKRKEKTPTVLGHEIVGKVVAFGPDAPRMDLNGHPIRVLDRISWAIYASNPDDVKSLAGIPQKAADLFKYGHEQITEDSHLHGGLAEFTVLRKHTPIIKLSEEMPLKVAAIINCAVSTVAGGLRLAGDIRGKNVLVSGAGMLGMIACAMSKALGAKHVVAIDINQERLLQARKYGADLALLANGKPASIIEETFEDPKPFHVIIELSGVTSAMEQTLDFLTIGGTAVWVGATYPQPEVKLNAEQLVRNLWTIRGLHNYNQHDFRAAVHFMEQHYQDFPFEEMVAGGFTLDQVNEAFTYANEQNPFRVGISF